MVTKNLIFLAYTVPGAVAARATSRIAVLILSTLYVAKIKATADLLIATVRSALVFLAAGGTEFELIRNHN